MPEQLLLSLQLKQLRQLQLQLQLQLLQQGESSIRSRADVSKSKRRHVDSVYVQRLQCILHQSNVDQRLLWQKLLVLQ